MAALLSVEDVRILICEDEYLLASGLAADLEARGVHVMGIVSRAAEGIAVLDDMVSEGLNAAIVDIRLLDGSAFPLVERLREKSVPVVFFSGYFAEDMPERFRDIPVVTKPGHIDALMEALLHALSAQQGSPSTSV